MDEVTTALLGELAAARTSHRLRAVAQATNRLVPESAGGDDVVLVDQVIHAFVKLCEEHLAGRGAVARDLFFRTAMPLAAELGQSSGVVVQSSTVFLTLMVSDLVAHLPEPLREAGRLRLAEFAGCYMRTLHRHVVASLPPEPVE